MLGIRTPCHAAGFVEGITNRRTILTEYNSHLCERFNKTQPELSSRPQQSPALPSQPNHPNIQKYYEEVEGDDKEWPSWAQEAEFPSAAEFLKAAEDALRLPVNKIDGAWASKEEYLSTNYDLLRGDTLLPLKAAVWAVKDRPTEAEAEFGGAIGLYDHVHIKGVTFSPRGMAFKLVFSLSRIGARVQWEQSKRLIAGSLVALTPKDDMFKTTCVLAVVAARPISGLSLNPPEIDIFFARPEETEFDPQVEWCMVENRSSFFEAGRHTLLALQKLIREPFPFQEHIVSVKPTIDAPQYVLDNPRWNLTPVTNTEEDLNVDVLRSWPKSLDTTLDKSQVNALRRILTQRLAIVQGPPGTGKTHVSVEALKVMISNMGPSDPPIIVTCQTNHAVDQLLRHVARFEPNFVRLGGRSKDQEIVKQRTLFEVRRSLRYGPGRLKIGAIRRMEQISKQMQICLGPYAVDKQALNTKLLLSLNLLTEAQCVSLDSQDSEWIRHDVENSQASPIEKWMGNQLIPALTNVRPDTFGIEFEEAEIEMEQLKDLEAEACAQDDEIEALTGVAVPIFDGLTGDAAGSPDAERIKQLLRTDNLWSIPKKSRGAVYRYWQEEVKKGILKSVREFACEYERQVKRRRIGGWEVDASILLQQKVVGMTTTGLSKYRALISALEPKVVLVEEAAETLEPPVIAACVPSLEHLILVGDHRQLRPHCQLHHLESEKFAFNVSLFERMVKNGVEFSQLQRQRRMIPEIRRLLRPVYGKTIRDHEEVKSVANRPPVAGMGGVSSFFFSHEWTESRDDNMSTFNQHEARMIARFVSYLILNGENSSKITILTFYNGQRKELLRQIRQVPDLRGCMPAIATVDSYQGEENDIVVLSLVRSNFHDQIGFLKNENRVCVSLSRAKRGFYLFGNGELLAVQSETWAQVVTIMAGKKGEIPPGPPKMRVGYSLPLQCLRHGRKTWIADPEDWEKISGAGCEQKCGLTLPCGHSCKLNCHPYDHDVINCQEQCQRAMSCGHQCRGLCYEACCCGTCVGSVRLPQKSGSLSSSIEEDIQPMPVQQAPPNVKAHPGPTAAASNNVVESQSSSMIEDPNAAKLSKLAEFDWLDDGDPVPRHKLSASKGAGPVLPPQRAAADRTEPVPPQQRAASKGAEAVLPYRKSLSKGTEQIRSFSSCPDGPKILERFTPTSYATVTAGRKSPGFPSGFRQSQSKRKQPERQQKQGTGANRSITLIGEEFVSPSASNDPGQVAVGEAFIPTDALDQAPTTSHGGPRRAPRDLLD